MNLLRNLPLHSLFIPLVLFFSSPYLIAQEWQTPLIEGYGEVINFHEAAQQSNPEQEYKLLFDVTSNAQKQGVNKRLWVVARMMNLMHIAQVPQEQVKIVVALHGEATFDALSQEAYFKKYNKPNPNLDLIEKLAAKGVSLYVCSQAMAARSIKTEALHPYVTPALSALSVLTNYQIKGYHLIP
ncbi:MAG: DsrE family protein [Flavobacteriaceae bacterium]